MPRYQVTTTETDSHERRWIVEAPSFTDAATYIEERHGEPATSVELVAPDAPGAYSVEWDEQMVTVEELRSLVVRLAEQIGQHGRRVESQDRSSHDRIVTGRMLNAMKALEHARACLTIDLPA